MVRPPDPFALPPGPIVVLDLDTVRADHLGTYGYSRDTTPWIDALATESLLFEWAFSQAPNTPPSQASILTGLYPSSHGMVRDEDRVPQAVTTLAEAFRAQGYATAAFVDGGYLSADFGFDQGFEVYDDNRGAGMAQIAPRAVDWVRQHADQPFLLLIHTYDAHTPYAPPEPYRSMFLEGLDPPSAGFEPDAQQLEAVRRAIYSDPEARLGAADLAFTKARYDGGLRYLDNWVHAFLDSLRGLGVYERATIVVLSDHGEEFQEHGSLLHEKLYSTVTRIPLIFRLPGGHASRRVTEVVESIDVMPTLLDLHGIAPPSGIQGRSLVPLMRGQASGPYRAIGESPFRGRQRFLASKDVRALLTADTGAIELYDFREDPLEQHDRAAERPETVQRIRAQLERWQSLIDRSRVAADDESTVDPETLEQLRALGYLD